MNGPWSEGRHKWRLAELGAAHFTHSVAGLLENMFQPRHPQPFSLAEAEQLDVSTIVAGELIAGIASPLSRGLSDN